MYQLQREGGLIFGIVRKKLNMPKLQFCTKIALLSSSVITFQCQVSAYDKSSSGAGLT